MWITGISIKALKPNGGTAIVAEDQETRAERSNLRQGQAIEDGAHGVLANTEVEIAPGRVLRAEISGAVKGQSRLA